MDAAIVTETERTVPVIESPPLEPLSLGARPATKSGALGVVMLHTSGRNDDIQWFEYKPTFFAGPTRIEWDNDTMSVVLPDDMAELLIKRGYARTMNAKEASTYNTWLAESALPTKGEDQ